MRKFIEKAARGCNRIVLFDGSTRHQGQFMDVKITRTGSSTLCGNPATVNL